MPIKTHVIQHRRLFNRHLKIVHLAGKSKLKDTTCSNFTHKNGKIEVFIEQLSPS